MIDLDKAFSPSLKPDRKSAALYAADCAEHVLYVFENERPDDKRAVQAIEAARKWAGGEISVLAARNAAVAANAAARDCIGEQSRAAARACAHAAATAHMQRHMDVCCDYALKASENRIAESEWQYEKYEKYI